MPRNKLGNLRVGISTNLRRRLVDVGNDEQVVDEVCTTLLSILLFKALSIVIGAVNGPNSVYPRLLGRRLQGIG
jgi:hypothetical protein